MDTRGKMLTFGLNYHGSKGLILRDLFLNTPDIVDQIPVKEVVALGIGLADTTNVINHFISGIRCVFHVSLPFMILRSLKLNLITDKPARNE